MSTHVAKWVDKNHQVAAECHQVADRQIVKKKMLLILLTLLSVHLAKWIDSNYQVAVE